MNFDLRAMPTPQEREQKFWFVFHGDRLLIRMDKEGASIPFEENLDRYDLRFIRKQYLGRIDGYPCIALEVLSGDFIDSKLEFVDLRQSSNLIEEDFFWLAGRAFEIINWSRNNEFCGKCGTKNENSIKDFSKICPDCGLVVYPRISPAIIVAITKGNKILLAQGKNFKGKFYSVLAGFVEPGETLEECVVREVYEEVGIKVKNITYFGSQPWPFPDSLMIGFTAEYEDGVINIDEEEISDAKWFAVDNIPTRPTSISIAKKLIDWFIENNR